MQYWLELFPRKIFKFDYDLLTINKEYEIKKLIEYLGLGWEEKCLYPDKNQRLVFTASSSQVRKKIYKNSSKQWENFKPFLNGIFDHLENVPEE